MNKGKLTAVAVGASIGALSGAAISHETSNKNTYAPSQVPKSERVIPRSVSATAIATVEDRFAHDKHRIFHEGNKIVFAKVLGEEDKITVRAHESIDGLVSGTETISSTPLTAPAGLGHPTTRTTPLQTEQLVAPSEGLENPNQALSEIEVQSQTIAENTSKEVIVISRQ